MVAQLLWLMRNMHRPTTVCMHIQHCLPHTDDVRMQHITLTLHSHTPHHPDTPHHSHITLTCHLTQLLTAVPTNELPVEANGSFPSEAVTWGWFWSASVRSALLCDSTSQPMPQLEPIFLHLKIQRRNHSAVLASHHVMNLLRWNSKLALAVDCTAVYVSDTWAISTFRRMII